MMFQQLKHKKQTQQKLWSRIPFRCRINAGYFNQMIHTKINPWADVRGHDLTKRYLWL
jgi:hypothetical protein